MNEKITLDHGSGGRASHDLIKNLLLQVFNSKTLAPMEDSALVQIGQEKIAFSTDSFVVDPIFFPGGNIGDLAINGTVNDIAMRGAQPLYISVAMIIEEGFPISDLEKVIQSIKKSADIAEVEIITGDTKVVPKGKADKIFINTTGIGVLRQNFDISAANAVPGDHVILSGTMADHGVTIVSKQEGLQISGNFQSDSAALNHIIQKLLGHAQHHIHVLRDPTRGGVATTLNEIAESSKMGIRLKEDSLPIRNDVRGACELLGLDPLYLANEGKFLIFVEPSVSEQVIQILKEDKLGKDSQIIGQVTEENPGKVLIDSPLGTSRLLDMLHGTPLPRIC